MHESPRSLTECLQEARAAYTGGEFARSLEILRSCAAQGDSAVAALTRDCYLNLGEISSALGEVSRMRRRNDNDALRRQARFMLGRLRETDVSWLPPVPEPTERVSPRDGVVMHLLKESLPYSQTGYTFRSRMTLEAQRRAGREPVVVTSLGFPAYKGVEPVDPIEHVDGIRHHRLGVPAGSTLPLKKIPFDIVLAEQAARTAQIVARERPALIQAGSGFRGYDQALVGLALARAYGVPFIYEVRGFLEATWSSRTDLQERGEYYGRRRMQDERCMRAADLVITIAGSMRDVLVERGIDPDKIRVVPNAVDIERFSPRAKDPELLQRLGLEGRFVVGYVSNLGRREGLEYLLRAAAKLVADGREVACLIVGDGPERDGLAKLALDLGLGDAAVLTGHVPNHEIEDYYALIDTFVVPRINDQAARLVTPLKPLEAMAMRIPLISSDLPALREIVEPGTRGLVFEPGDDADLASTIAVMMDDPGLRASLVDAAYDWVASERTIDANVERYRSALAGLAS